MMIGFTVNGFGSDKCHWIVYDIKNVMPKKYGRYRVSLDKQSHLHTKAIPALPPSNHQWSHPVSQAYEKYLTESLAPLDIDGLVLCHVVRDGDIFGYPD